MSRMNRGRGVDPAGEFRSAYVVVTERGCAGTRGMESTHHEVRKALLAGILQGGEVWG